MTLFIDLGAERLIAAQRGIEKIAVEIKTFLRDSLVTELHLTVGQLLNYRLALLESEPERILYLAVPKDPYFSFFISRYAQRIIQAHQIKLIIYDFYSKIN